MIINVEEKTQKKKTKQRNYQAINCIFNIRMNQNERKGLSKHEREEQNRSKKISPMVTFISIICQIRNNVYNRKTTEKKTQNTCEKMRIANNIINTKKQTKCCIVLFIPTALKRAFIWNCKCLFC